MFAKTGPRGEPIATPLPALNRFPLFDQRN